MVEVQLANSLAKMFATNAKKEKVEEEELLQCSRHSSRSFVVGFKHYVQQSFRPLLQVAVSAAD